MAKGFSQRDGVDYEEISAPTMKISTIHLLLAITTHFGWKAHQMDIKSSFLNDDLEEEVYMIRP